MEARAMSSPLEPIFGRAQAPAAFKAQFLHSVDDPSRIVLEGTLHHVWHRPWFWPWVIGTVRFVQRADNLDIKRVEIELVISHPLLGDVFGYDGTFWVRRYES